MELMFIGLGGFLGAMARYSVSLWAKRHFSNKFPIGTLIVNWIGAFCLGMLSPFSGPISLLLGTGFLGSFTTFSTFKLESLHHHIKSEWGLFFLYIGLTYIGGIALAFLGVSITS